MNNTLKSSSLCSLTSRKMDEDPIGSAPIWEKCLILEVKQPWDSEILDSSSIPKSTSLLLKKLTNKTIGFKFQAVIPRSNRTTNTWKIMFFKYTEQGFCRYTKSEYEAPLKELNNIITSLALSSNSSLLNKYKVENESERDILVCTHGNRDSCCGKLGFQTYSSLLSSQNKFTPKTQIWRTSHTGGHRFAATLIDLPSGRYWGHLDPNLAKAILLKEIPFLSIAKHYRGSSAMNSSEEQVLEKKVLSIYDWDSEKQFEFIKNNRPSLQKRESSIYARVKRTLGTKHWTGTITNKILEIPGCIGKDKSVKSQQYTLESFEEKSI